MNLGAARACGDIFLFLHADTYLPAEACDVIIRAVSQCGYCWGRFNVRILGSSWILPLVAFLMNWRSRLTGIATGDQAIFVKSLTFHAINGFPNQPLMEDIKISKRLKRIAICLSWETNVGSPLKYIACRDPEGGICPAGYTQSSGWTYK